MWEWATGNAWTWEVIVQEMFHQLVPSTPFLCRFAALLFASPFPTSSPDSTIGRTTPAAVGVASCKGFSKQRDMRSINRDLLVLSWREEEEQKVCCPFWSVFFIHLNFLFSNWWGMQEVTDDSNWALNVPSVSIFWYSPGAYNTTQKINTFLKCYA